MSIRIFTDSASDITREELEELQVELIAMPLQCGEETYVDDKTTPVETFWQMLLDGVNIKTSLPSPDTFVQKFEAAKAAGDEVVCILIASKLSGTYQGAMLAKQIVDYDGIHVIDAGHAAASVAEKMLVIAACRMRDQGCTAGEIVQKVEELRSRVRLIACLDTLEYLARGGRLPAAVASIGTKLQVKPIIVFGEEGEIQVAKKCMGGKRAMRDMTAMVTERGIDPDYPVIPIFAQNDGNCQGYVASLENAGCEGKMQTPQGIGATIGSYIGPSAYGIVFVEK
ncbi:MAG: DegV family protein [Lachnospiraceae bacterium]|nr:DegV family protein [Lachnospiraceae bacterium]